ncbi:hypothetical protein [Bacillus cereus group sp. MG11]|uniref:hypothetical protein n=1 Tax=Bacillus cereus group sp. MG11 TaxID=3040248 RepID=UPI003397B75C
MLQISTTDEVQGLYVLVDEIIKVYTPFIKGQKFNEKRKGLSIKLINELKFIGFEHRRNIGKLAVYGLKYMVSDTKELQEIMIWIGEMNGGIGELIVNHYNQGHIDTTSNVI